MGVNTDTAQEAMLLLADKLEPLLPLANCHMVDFLTRELWAEFLSSGLAADLDTINEDELSILLAPDDDNDELMG